MIGTGRRINDFDTFMNHNQMPSPRQQVPLANIHNYHSNQERHQYSYQYSAHPIASATPENPWSALLVRLDPRLTKSASPKLIAGNSSAPTKIIPIKKQSTTFTSRIRICTTAGYAPHRPPVKASQSIVSLLETVLQLGSSIKLAGLCLIIRSTWETSAITSLLNCLRG